MGATYVYTGKRRTAASSSSPNDILDPFELLNLNLSWTNIFGAPVDLTAFATNVLQEKYATYASGTYNTTGVDSRMVGLPRMIGERLKYRFGNMRWHGRPTRAHPDRKTDGKGQGGSVRVGLGGRRMIKKKN